jgi:predicted GH43/DUF377 family glycosyl hydrolase
MQRLVQAADQALPRQSRSSRHEPGVLWESRGTINPAAIDLGDKTHILYRAVSADNISTVGYAVSSDGLSIDERAGQADLRAARRFERKE